MLPQHMPLTPTHLSPRTPTTTYPSPHCHPRLPIDTHMCKRSPAQPTCDRNHKLEKLMANPMTPLRPATVRNTPLCRAACVEHTAQGHSWAGSGPSYNPRSREGALWQFGVKQGVAPPLSPSSARHALLARAQQQQQQQEERQAPLAGCARRRGRAEAHPTNHTWLTGCWSALNSPKKAMRQRMQGMDRRLL